MEIHDSINNSVCIFEIKHSMEINESQIRHLKDEEKLKRSAMGKTKADMGELKLLMA